ncbi:uncharacterized protein RJT21DRAFT_118870 [Scheffersomyces amazonensis]|uniref:uncharacterized protein n=1 Tax=Scheffersomyces amazonensis TaxID=1078765 RepID=UPI00315CC7E8
MSLNKKIRPAKRLVNATGKCAVEGSLYGQCILQKYATIRKDDCAKEFQAFQQCVNANIAK